MTNKKGSENKNLPAEINEFEKKQQELKRLIDECLKIIEKEEILFVTDLIGFLPISKATFYNYGLDKIDAIREAIEKQRIQKKQMTRKALVKTNTPVGLITFYRMIATPEERAAINNYHEPKQIQEEGETPIKDLFESLKRRRL